MTGRTEAIRARPARGATAVHVNDVHSRLNPTRVAEVAPVRSVGEIRAVLRRAARARRSVAVAGGRHAMGGQQFGADGVLLDLRPLDRLLGYDAERGLLEAEAGIAWPRLVRGYLRRAQGKPAFGIAQKQTGADELTLGGSLAANVHGRGLAMPPIVADVESFVLVAPDGEVLRCSRTENAELFRLAIGGYGLFGVIARVTLRLAPRRKLRRRVEILAADELPRAFARRIAAGFLYGDFQFSIDPADEGFLRRGVFSCYEPVPGDVPMRRGRRLGLRDWQELVRLAHVDKGAAFRRYAAHYLATDGQIYWSDTSQLAPYLEGYHAELDPRLPGPRGTEMISELFVPRPELGAFLDAARELLRARRADLIYGTVRLIERDQESLLAWAREPWACVIFNLHTEHSPAGIARSRATFRGLIDLALGRGGTYYLTYHRWATRSQLLAGHPRLPELLRRKRELDPGGVLQSDWYRHHLALVGEAG